MPSKPDYGPIAKDISCYGLPYGLFGICCWLFSLIWTAILFTRKTRKQSLLRSAIKLVITLGPVIASCITCNRNWVFILMALGKLGPEAFKQLNTRIIISKSIPDEKEEVNRQLTGTMRWFAVFTTISLCLAGWAALVAFVVKVPSDNHDPEWAKFLNVIVGVVIFILLLSCVCWCLAYCVAAVCCCLSGDMCGIVGFVLPSSHVLFSHIILADLYNNWYGIPLDLYQKVSAIIFAIGINIEFFEVLEILYNHLTSLSDS